MEMLENATIFLFNYVSAFSQQPKRVYSFRTKTTSFVMDDDSFIVINLS